MARIFARSRTFALTLTLTFALTPAAHAITDQGHQLVISAPSRYAVEIGRKIAQKGGNVVDVAVAIGLTLSVTSPYFASLGGGGFALVKVNGPVQAIDFREVAPKAAGRDFYLKLPKGASLNGGTAVGVPGFPAGLYALHQKHGKLKWPDLFEEPMRLAAQGFLVSGEWVETTIDHHDRFNKSAIAKFFNSKGAPLKPGETLKQPALARALALLKTKGPKGFYEGAVAKDIVDTVNAAGGKFALEDMKNYKVRWLTPLETTYEGHKIYLMPPPSSGGVVIHTALKMIEQLELKKTPALGTDEFHLLSEIEARAFRGRALLGDPDFHQNPVTFLTSESYLNELTKSVNPKKTVALKPLTDAEVKESTHTTHYSVMDAKGNGVSLTVTLNDNYGSGVVSDKFGIALNNEMDDFTTRPGEPNLFGLIQGPGNEVQPGKRPLSSMSPTLIEKNGNLVMAIGAKGGPRIITGVLQSIYRILGRGTDVDLAVQAPRVHHQFQPNITYIDSGRFSPEVVQGLKSKGHQVEETWMAKVYVVRKRGDGVLEAAFDSRAEGAAGGL